ncbi:NUDIX domain-containing protein [Falsiroseomonas sp. CW058]|uniref:NUDIX domain-containing protein n=1 Tax=Falsiroseomonas sp. CW058 TaxID=3388664 RepID=UPI003D31F939
MTARYVLGFALSLDRRSVMMIRKLRPSWQAGLLNGVGGRIEDGETPAAAMRREGWEEAGVDLDWSPLATLRGEGFHIEAFEAFSDEIWRAFSKTDEPVGVYPVAEVIGREHPMPRNIPLFLSLALDESGIMKPVHLSEVAALRSPEDVGDRERELLEANNREVERRRVAEQSLRSLMEAA